MKKFLLTTALFVAMTASASAAYMCNDNSYESNVRSGPSAQTYSIIDKLDNNYPVVVVDTTRNAAGFLWAKIRYNSMRYGRPTVETGWVDGGSVCVN
jgi:uncharacterized protein YgiM (DUF1202 family)